MSVSTVRCIELDGTAVWMSSSWLRSVRTAEMAAASGVVKDLGTALEVKPPFGNDVCVVDIIARVIATPLVVDVAWSRLQMQDTIILA